MGTWPDHPGRPGAPADWLKNATTVRSAADGTSEGFSLSTALSIGVNRPAAARHRRIAAAAIRTPSSLTCGLSAGSVSRCTQA